MNNTQILDCTLNDTLHDAPPRTTRRRALPTRFAGMPTSSPHPFLLPSVRLPHPLLPPANSNKLRRALLHQTALTEIGLHVELQQTTMSAATDSW